MLAACTLLWACDQAPGPPTDAGDPPVLSDFSFSPHEYAVPHDANGEALTIPLTMAVTATDADDDLQHVSFVVQSPFSADSAAAEGTLSRTSGERFEAASDVTIPSGDVGVYTVLVYAVDQAGSLSDEVRGMLRVHGAGEPPVIEDVVAPDTVWRPAAGDPDEHIEFIAVVSDPDGLSNVNTVEFWNADRPSTRIEMFDNGEQGDATAGDGRYTRVVEISSSNQPGTNMFAFEATDLSGLSSSIVEKTVVVE